MTDLKFAVRQLLKHPLSNSVIVMTVAVLVAMVSTLYATTLEAHLKKLPFKEPDQLLRFWRVGKGKPSPQFPAAVFLELKRHLTLFEHIGGIRGAESKTLTGWGDPRSLHGKSANASILEMSGVAPLHGRLFSKADESPGSRVVILAHHAWLKVFDGAEEIVGKTITLNNQDHYVIGILSPDMDDTCLAPYGTPDFWMPSDFSPGSENVEMMLSIFGRLKEGVTRQQAEAELESVSVRVENERPLEDWEKSSGGSHYSHSRALPLGESLGGYRGLAGDDLVAYGLGGLLIGGVVFIASFNVVGLLLGRMVGRTREIALRYSLGASRRNLVSQILVEIVLLSVLGGIVGLMLALWFVGVARVHRMELVFEPKLYGIALGSSVLLGLAMGIVPALRGTSANLMLALKDGGLTVLGVRRHRTRSIIACGQIFLATLLICVTGLSFHSFVSSTRFDPGFDSEHMATVSHYSPRKDVYATPEERVALARHVRDQLAAVAGVREVAVASPQLDQWSRPEVVYLSGENRRIDVDVIGCSSNLFDVLNVRLLGGSAFNTSGDTTTPQAVVNQMFVDQFLDGKNPFDVTFRWSRYSDSVFNVVGVVTDRPPLQLGVPPKPEIFVPYGFSDKYSSYQFWISTLPGAASVESALTETVRDIDPAQPPRPASVFSKELSNQRSNLRDIVVGVSLWSLGALFLAVFGIYGLIASMVIERTREIGIRATLGASRTNVTALFVRRGLGLILIGMLPALGVAFVVARFLPPEFHMVTRASSPLVYLEVALATLAAGLFACGTPARRAAKVDPMVALRAE